MSGHNHPPYCPPCSERLVGACMVTIDAEDREQVERLLRAMDYWSEPFTDKTVDRMRAALRELANPTPPKPEEPTGLGAVVEDAEGRKWVRTFLRYGTGWVSHDEESGYEPYADISAVRVLSEGVTP